MLGVVWLPAASTRTATRTVDLNTPRLVGIADGSLKLGCGRREDRCAASDAQHSGPGVEQSAIERRDAACPAAVPSTKRHIAQNHVDGSWPKRQSGGVREEASDL